MTYLMSWEEKFEAILALGEASLKMRVPGDWYVHQPDVEVSDGTVIGPRSGTGRTPELAVLDYWKNLTALTETEVVVIDAFRENRKHVRWNGYRWVDLMPDFK